DSGMAVAMLRVAHRVQQVVRARNEVFDFRVGFDVFERYQVGLGGGFGHVLVLIMRNQRAIRQMETTLSSPADTRYLPSAENTTERTGAECPPSFSSCYRWLCPRAEQNCLLKRWPGAIQKDGR